MRDRRGLLLSFLPGLAMEEYPEELRFDSEVVRLPQFAAAAELLEAVMMVNGLR